MSLDTLLSSPSVSSIPNIQGGHAGPSSAASPQDVYTSFNSPFTVAGQGANAAATNDQGQRIPTFSGQTLIFIALIAGGVFLMKG